MTQENLSLKNVLLYLGKFPGYGFGNRTFRMNLPAYIQGIHDFCGPLYHRRGNPGQLCHMNSVRGGRSSGYDLFKKNNTAVFFQNRKTEFL